MGGGGAYPGMKNYVFSRTMKQDLRKKVKNLEFISEDAAEFVRKLRAQEGKDICVMGGGLLAKSLFEADLIDEIGFNIHPVLLGSGIPVFHEMDHQIDLELLECKPLKNGCVMVTYRVKPPREKREKKLTAKNAKKDVAKGKEAVHKRALYANRKRLGVAVRWVEHQTGKTPLQQRHQSRIPVAHHKQNQKWHGNVVLIGDRVIDGQGEIATDQKLNPGNPAQPSPGRSSAASASARIAVSIVPSTGSRTAR